MVFMDSVGLNASQIPPPPLPLPDTSDHHCPSDLCVNISCKTHSLPI